MTTSPKMAIIMPVHNGMPFLPQAIDSILAQSFTPFELYVIDDGSTDETPRFLRAQTDQRIHCYRFDKVGLCEALNFGIYCTKSPLIARMDADDVAEPQRLEQQYQFMLHNSDCVLLGCQSTVINLANEVVAEHCFPLSDQAIRWQMAFSCPFQHPGVLYRRQIVLDCGGYQAVDGLIEDYDLWIKLAAKGKLANHPLKLLRYRVHPTSITGTHSERQIDLCSRYAAEYASRLLPNINFIAVRDLYHFLGSGRLPGETTMRDLSIAFQSWRSYFLQVPHADSPDLFPWVQRTQECLRWRCLDQVSQNRRNPRAAFSWLRLAGSFDPQNGSMHRLCFRWFRRKVMSAIAAS